METILGDALKIILGNPDVQIIGAVFSIGIAIMYTLIAAWKYIERSNNENERF